MTLPRQTGGHRDVDLPRLMIDGAAFGLAGVSGFDTMLAEGVGFEPTVGFHLRRFSSPLDAHGFPPKIYYSSEFRNAFRNTRSEIVTTNWW